MNNQPTLNITWGSIYKILVAVIAIYILYVIKDIIVWFLFALVIGILFNHIIDILEQKKIPRILSAIVLYLAVFVLLSFFIYKTAPIILDEFKEFAQNFPEYLKKVVPVFERLGIKIDVAPFQDSNAFLQTLQNNLSKVSTNVLNALFSIFGGATSTVLVLALAFFISLEKDFFARVITAVSPGKYKGYFFGLWKRAKQKVSGWFITRVIGVLFVGAATYLVLSILKVKYAFILSIMAGLFDLVPIIGPAVAGLVMFLLVALNSLFQAIFAGGAFIIIQQLENNLLFPILFKKLIGLSPILVLIALAVGGKLWGAAGAILAIPMAGVLFEVLKDYLARVKRNDKRTEPAVVE